MKKSLFCSIKYKVMSAVCTSESKGFWRIFRKWLGNPLLPNINYINFLLDFCPSVQSTLTLDVNYWMTSHVSSKRPNGAWHVKLIKYVPSPDMSCSLSYTTGMIVVVSIEFSPFPPGLWKCRHNIFHSSSRPSSPSVQFIIDMQLATCH